MGGASNPQNVQNQMGYGLNMMAPTSDADVSGILGFTPGSSMGYQIDPTGARPSLDMSGSQPTANATTQSSFYGSPSYNAAARNSGGTMTAGGTTPPATTATTAASGQPNIPTTATTAASGQPDVAQTAANMYNAAAAGPNIAQFMNPYTSMVTGQAMQDLDRQRQMATNDIGAAASRAGAFGGSRHGVSEALTNTGFAQQGASMFANLQQQGFNTALGAAQNQQGIQSGLAGQGFGFAEKIADRQMNEGNMMRAINDALIAAGKGQFAGFTGAPSNALNPLIAATSGANMGQQTTTETKKNGLLDYIKAAAGIWPS